MHMHFKLANIQYMKAVFIFTVFFLFSLSIYSQTGPAGVGSSTSNILWLRSHDLSTLSSGDKIATWADKSGNGNDLTQTDDLFKPDYVSGQQNGYGVVRFNKSINRLVKTSFSDFPTSAITVLIVSKSNSESNDGLFSYAKGSSDNEFLLYNTNTLTTYRGGSTANSSFNFSNNAWHIIDVSWKSSGGDVIVCKDNDFFNSYTSTIANGSNIGSGGALALGSEQDSEDGGYNSGQTHNGDVLEVIVYNIELNTAQRIIVSNYIAAKYNLTISNDLFAYQSTHPHELAGIGRYDGSNIHASAQSADMITIGNASAMATDGEYLLFGHDDANATAWTTTEKAEDNTQRIEREWRIDETGDVGTIDITLNNDDLAALPAGYTKYGLMVDSDGDFSSGAVIYEMTVSGDDYIASGIDIADGDYISIAAIEPIIQFKETTSSGIESSNASIEILLNYTAASAASVNYSTSNGTAVAGSDYTAAAGSTLTIAAGYKSNNLSISINNDSDQESDEDFTINLSSPSSGINLGTAASQTHNYTINDNDNTRKIYFSSASSNGTEATTSASITIEINTIDNSDPTTVDYSVIGGTAAGGGEDYTLASGTATITSGNTSTTFSISVNNDIIDEDNETIIVKLSNSSSNCNLSSTNPIEHTYTINDNDATPSIQFTSTASSGNESVGTKNLQLSLSTVSGKDVSVSFSHSGTATYVDDYSILTSSPITISAGSTTKNIVLTINDDNTTENSETAIVTISGPTNASLGASTSHTYTILNDDIFGYVGPGGIGKSLNLKLWVKAEDIPGSSNGDKISSWADQSGNSNNLSQSEPTVKPYYYNDIVNGFPVARYSDDNSRLIKNNFSDFPTKEITTFFVNYRTAASNDATISYAVASGNNEYLVFNSSNISVFRTSVNVSSGVNAAANSWNIVSTSWRNSDDNVVISLNGQQKYSNTLSNANDITSGGCLVIGAEQDAVDGSYAADQDFEGDFAEVVIYNSILNTAQKNIISNYLSAKYNITMDANDKYAGDDSGKGDYDFEVIGIGSESDGFHDEAHGSGGLWIKQSTNFGNGDYLMIGHNHITPQLYTSAEDAGLTAVSIDERWGRDWYFDLTDAGGAMTVDLTFDFDEAEMNSSSTPAGTTSNYKLLYRSGTSGDWSIVNSASSKTTSQILFTGQALPNGDGYYALGTIDATSSPLPIELMSFDAQLENKNVILKWETASETNNDYFEIYRSANTEQWTKIGVVDGSGTTNTIRSYNYSDIEALQGISYYKLKQVDFDGKYTFSQIRSVSTELSERIEIYPNPTNGIVYINNVSAGSRIELLDLNSRVILFKDNIDGGSAEIYLSNLPASIYLIRITTDNTVNTYKLVKK
ncbi:MAG: hypothetical protein DRI86_01495 [Bacteroidetes bacterium]|nr:MAG: hypothetical protein DRI86_01495 [Bacteroidota bacterium]